MKVVALTVALIFGWVSSSNADIFNITITGEVEFNGISASPLGDANTGDDVEIFFQVDANNFLNGTFPTRGYEIILDSFVMQLGAVTIGLQDPFPAAETPYFVIRNNDPAVDGFFLANNPDAFPNGVPLDQTGSFGQFRIVYSTTYGGDTLPSLDIADAVGFYDFTGLTVFTMTITDGPFDAMGMVFTNMTIESANAVPEPGAAALLVAFGLIGLRRRR